MSNEVSSKTLDEIDEAREKEDLKKLEAVFFVSGRFLNMQELIGLSDLNPVIVRELIAKLKEKYGNFDSAIEIIEKNGMWKMDVGQEYSGIINKLATGSAEFSKAEQETLAIIAYKQPIKQSVIIKIRGNKAYDHIKKFADLNLLKKKKEGHTHILSLADDFYDYFSVRNSEEGISERDSNSEETMNLNMREKGENDSLKKIDSGEE
ncbi:MAG: SMC-Scp complex subunit ScpB [Candidatus Pacearchaeota archaeon]